MKILSANQIKQWDKATLKSEKISSLQLMERAANNCSRQIMQDFKSTVSFHIIVGKGNNGADGLVIARKLLLKKYKVRVTILEFTKKESHEFATNLTLLHKDVITIIQSANDIVFNKNEIIIDAIFGYGLNRKTSGEFAKTIDGINNAKAKILSIDIPSGLFADDNRQNNGSIIRADITYTFECMKFSFLLESNLPFFGQVKLIDIGLDKQFLQILKTKNYLLTNDSLPPLKNRPKTSHKGSFGHTLLIGGNEEMRGAIILSAKSALRTGVGKISVSLPKQYIKELNRHLPEAMLDYDISEFSKYNAIGIGPGMGTDKKAENQMKELLRKREAIPLVLDADALNIISKNKNLLRYCKGAIITPHIGEFKRLCGAFGCDEEKLEKQILFAKKHKVVVVLKGPFSSIASPCGNLYFNNTGNSGMATAGSGDVLLGIILGLLTQGYSAKDAACLGVFLHAKAGDLALDKQSKESLISSDITDNLGRAFDFLKAK